MSGSNLLKTEISNIFSVFFFFFFSSSFFSKKLPIIVVVCRTSVRSSMSIISFSGNLIFNWPIDPKIGLNVGYGALHL